MVDRVLVAGYGPLQGVARDRWRNAETVVDSRLDLSSLFVVVPSDQLQSRQLSARIVQLVDFREGLEPGLAALLAHDAV